MANYQNLMAVINAVIKTNNRREITGQVLQNVLNTMVSSIGENMQLTGFATPTTNPGQPDQNIFYVAKQAGTYSYFNNITLGNGLSFLMWKNGQWSYETIGIPDLEWVRQNFVSIDFFRRIFRVLNSSNAEIFPNDTISAIDNVEALVAFWSDYYVSALGRGSGGGGGGGGGGGDVTWTALADNSDNHQIALSHLTGALTGYATQSWVQSQNYATQLWVQSQSYATQTWVQNQNYASQAWVGQNYISISYFDRLFRAYNGSTLVNHNDTSSTIDNIKAMFGFWTDFYISALGGGGASSVDLRLAQLSDVNVAGVTNGQALVYDSTLGKWIPGTGGLDLTAMWTALGANTNNQINISHLTTALSSYATQQWVTSQGYLTPSAISDMATQTWVNTQISDMATKTWVNTQISDMATQTWVGQNYISIAYFDRLFRAYNGSTLVNHNNTTSTIDNIKAMFGFWTEYYLSALGNGGSIGSSISLSQLADVSISSPTNGQVLVYDSTTQKWKNGAGGGGGSGDVTWNALAAATNEQINASHLTTALSGYATTSALSGYLPLSGGTMTGKLTISVGSYLNQLTIKRSDSANDAMINFENSSGYLGCIGVHSGKYPYFCQTNQGSPVWRIWTSGNDGSDSGLDADLLDGQHGSYYAAASSLSNYLPLSGGTMTGKLTFSQGSSTRDVGIIGTYDPNKAAAIWSMGSSYQIKADGTTMGSLYGACYVYYGNGYHYGAGYSGSHSFVWAQNGTAYCALGDYVWAKNGFKKNGSSDSYVLLGGGGHAAISGLSVSYATSAGTASTADMIKNNITVSSSSSVDNGIWFNNGTRNVLFGTGTSGNTGIYVTNTGWVVGVNSSGSVFLNGNATTATSATSSGSCSGNAASATQLQTSRTIWGQSFNGTANVSGNMTGVGNISSSSSYVLYDSSSNPYLNLKVGSQNWYVQSMSNGIYLGSTSSKSLKVDASGNVTVTSNFTASGAVTALSDARHKTIINPTDLQVEQIARMPAVVYRWNDGREDNGLHVGSIAQDWQTVLPEVVLRAKDKEGTLSIQYGVAALVSTIITARKVVDHERRIAELEKENKRLRELLKVA